MTGIKAAAELRDDKILRLPELLERVSMSRATIYRKESAGKFPKRVPMGDNMVGWYESEVRRWISNPLGYRS